MVCLGNMCMATLHKGDNYDDDDDNNNNHSHEKLKFHTPDFVCNKHNTYAALQTNLYSTFHSLWHSAMEGELE